MFNELVKVIVTYKGEPLSKQYFEDHLEIQQMYPSMEEYQQKLYGPLVEQAQRTGEQQTLEISENEIKINGAIVTL